MPLVKKTGSKSFELCFTSKTFQHQVYVNVAGTSFCATDNYFDLFPKVARAIAIETEKAMDVAALKKRLQITALADSYE